MILIKLLFILSLICIVVNLFLGKSYKLPEYYRQLPTKRFKAAAIKEYNLVSSTDGRVIWHANSNDFKVDHDTYLHSAFFVYLDPYSFYWLIKYRIWFNKNCGHLKFD